jgi:hypothetical protein
MRDVHELLLAPDARLTRAESHRILDAAAALHAASRDRVPDGAARLRDRLGIPSPAIVEAERPGPDLLTSSSRTAGRRSPRSSTPTPTSPARCSDSSRTPTCSPTRSSPPSDDEVELGMLSVARYGWLLAHSARVHPDPAETAWGREELGCGSRAPWPRSTASAVPRRADRRPETGGRAASSEAPTRGSVEPQIRA